MLYLPNAQCGRGTKRKDSIVMLDGSCFVVLWGCFFGDLKSSTIETQAPASLCFSISSHLGEARRILDVDHFEALIIVSISRVVMMTLNVVEAVGAVRSRHWYHP